MTETATAEQLYCANCSDPADELDEENLGRCCHNLPHPWHRGSDGLYTAPSYSEDAEGEDDQDGDERPSCPYCEAQRFIVRAYERRRVAMSQSVSGQNDDYDDTRLWYERAEFQDDDTVDHEDFEVYEVVCARCHNDVTHDVELEEV
jgi:DNA-directed RNA polymerase subunit RPC12/RpoP